MNGYEKQRNSLETRRIGKVQLGDARELNSEVKSGYEQQWICVEKHRRCVAWK